MKKLVFLFIALVFATASYAATAITLTASVSGSGGTVSPATLNRYPGAQATAPFFVFTPTTGYRVTAINGLPASPYAYTLTNAISGAAVSLPAGNDVKVKVAFTYLGNSNVSLSGTFLNYEPIANAGASQTVLYAPATTVTLDGSGTLNTTPPVTLTYSWVRVSGPAAVTLITPTASKATFALPSNLGTYNFRLTVSGGGYTTTSLTSVIVTNNVALAAWNQCAACHKTNGVASGANGSPNVYGQWSTSRHAKATPPNMCYGCHLAANAGGHPGLPLPQVYYVCAQCHVVQSAAYTASRHGDNPGGYFGKLCVTCHDPHTTKAARNVCSNCHVNILTPQALAWQGSKHNTAANNPLIPPAPGGNVTCSTCHNKHTLVAALSICASCHTTGNPYGLPWPPSSDLAFHSQFDNTPDVCVSCHNAHSLAATMPFPHFNNITSYSNPGYTAMFITPRTQCSYCHGTPLRFQNNTTYAAKARFNWNSSGKGNVYSPAWKNSPTHDWKTAGTAGLTPQNNYTKNDCVRCHTAKGFTQFMGSGYTNIAPVGVATDKTSEPLTCNACHNTDSVVNPGFSLRANSDYTAYYNYSTPQKRISVVFNKFYGNFFNLTDVYPGNSNLCIPCHAGRESGDVLLKAEKSGVNFTNLGFINSHYMTAAGTMYQSTGFKYYTTAAQSVAKYTPSGGVTFHWLTGTSASPVGGTNGPCAACHFSTDKPHSFKALQYDATGAIIINPTTICLSAGCHVGKDAAFFQQQSDDFRAALDAVEYLLKTKKGIYYDGAKYPYFFNSELPNKVAITNWGTDSRTMGAAFNFNLLKREPGAWAHNPVYAKRLIYDTVDYLDDGRIGVTTNINYVPTPANLGGQPSVFWTGIGFLNIVPMPTWAVGAQTYLDHTRP